MITLGGISMKHLLQKRKPYLLIVFILIAGLICVSGCNSSRWEITDIYFTDGSSNSNGAPVTKFGTLDMVECHFTVSGGRSGETVRVHPVVTLPKDSLYNPRDGKTNWYTVTTLPDKEIHRVSAENKYG